MRTGGVFVIMVLAAAIGLTGCGQAVDPDPTSQPTDGSQLVTATGLAGLTVGEQRTALIREQGMRRGPGDCAPRLPDRPSVSPVFDGEQLVLLWADPPLRTAAGVAVGSSVDEVRTHYPDAEPLAAADSHQYDGLLVPVGGHAYLFLHDEKQVQKLIVGYETHARRLFEDGFGTC